MTAQDTAGLVEQLDLFGRGEETLHDALTRLGISHQRDEHSHMDRRHLLCRGPEVLGRYDAVEAWQFVHTPEGVRHASDRR